MIIERKCECGCGKQVKSNRKINGRLVRFINGHNKAFKGKHHSEENKLVASLARIGIKRPPFSEQHKRNMAISKMGDKNPSKLLKVREKISNTKLLKRLPGPWKDKKRSEETKRKLSLSLQELWRNPEYALMMGIAQHRKPNKIETKLGDLLNKMYPNEWKYTGDFKFIVDGKSPDFTNINDKKKLIELFGDYWHRDDNPDTRISHFSSFGYDTLVIWEHEFTNIENVMNKIRNFQDQP